MTVAGAEVWDAFSKIEEMGSFGVVWVPADGSTARSPCHGSGETRGKSPSE